MPANTPRLVLPYPSGTDPNNYPGQMQSLAQALDPIVVTYIEGLAANRPSPATHGRVYSATDTGNLYWDTGTAWIQLNLNAAATITARGDLLVGSGPGALARMGVGADGQSLTAQSGATNGLSWQSILGMPLALSGASAPTRYVGGTSSGAPVTGTFAQGDWLIDQTGRIWVCTISGSPGTWVDPTAALRIALFGSATRTQAAEAQIDLNTTFSGLAANTDFWGTGGWAAVTDTDNMFTAGNASGSPVPSFLTMPLTGRYKADFWCGIQSTGGQSAACKILKNTGAIAGGTAAGSYVPTYSIASGQNLEGTPHAAFEGILNAGDTLRWSMWCQAAFTLSPTIFGNIQTRVSLRWLRPN